MQHFPKYNSSGSAVVVGLGVSGVACTKFLLNDGWDVEVCDVVSRPHLERRFKSTMPGIPVNAPIYPQLFLNTDLVAMSCTSAHSDESIVRQAEKFGAEVLSSLELFFRHRSKPTIAVSGTNGKSTVNALINHVIDHAGQTAKIGGCGGMPFLDLLNSSSSDIFLLGLSSLQLEQVKSPISPDVATILNAYSDHLERYESASHYVSAMSKVIENAQKVVLNREDNIVANLPTSGERMTFGRNPASSEQDFGIVEKNQKRWIAKGNKPLVDLDKCQLKGAHNELNLLAACAILEAAGFSVEAATEQITNYRGLPFRCDLVGEWNGVRWINDARSSNVSATVAAIKSTNNDPIVLILGGLSKAANFSEIYNITGERLRGCIFYGRDARNISQAFNGRTQKVFVESMREAIFVAESLAEEGDSVVFSPGCASHDMFPSFKQRGKAFNKALKSHFAS